MAVNASATPDPESRYARVMAILAAAAGQHPSEGLGRFWELPLAKFLETRVFGVRLIAPAVEPSCCGDPEGRSAASGLIRGLRGAPPFDGSRFPPLMWRGSRVADVDIAFIAEWIDDGCPADDRGSDDIGAVPNDARSRGCDDCSAGVTESRRRRHQADQGRRSRGADLRRHPTRR